MTLYLVISISIAAAYLTHGDERKILHRNKKKFQTQHRWSIRARAEEDIFKGTGRLDSDFTEDPR